MKSAKQNLRFDLTAGVVVAIVALPLALGFGVTSGAGAASGLATAIIAGFIAALLGGSNYQVSGPTGAMVVVLVPIVAQLGPQGLVATGLLAGLFVILAAALRVGKYIERIPWSVMEGFTLGIALVIALQQLPLIFDVARPESTETIAAAAETINTALAEPLHLWSLGVVALTLVVKITWNKIRNKVSTLKAVPASGVAVLALSLFVFGSAIPVKTIGPLPAGDVFSFQWGFELPEIQTLLSAAFAIAVLAAIESLLSARVADSMVHRRDGEIAESYRPNRELFGQGIATIAASMFGGMPATGAIARTAVNVNSGARTKFAAAFHAIVLLAMVFLLAGLVSEIPVAVLAAVLLGASWRIANPQSIMENLRTTIPERITYLATAIAVVGLDLIWGIAIGLVVHAVASRLAK